MKLSVLITAYLLESIDFLPVLRLHPLHYHPLARAASPRGELPLRQRKPWVWLTGVRPARGISLLEAELKGGGVALPQGNDGWFRMVLWFMMANGSN